MFKESIVYDPLSGGGIISENYDLNKNQNSYVKARVGENTILVNKIFEESSSYLSDTNKVSGVYYVAVSFTEAYWEVMYGEGIGEYLGTYPFTPIEILETEVGNSWVTEYTGSDGTSTTLQGTQIFYDINQGTKNQTIKSDSDQYIYYPQSLVEFFTEISEPITSMVDGNTTTLCGFDSSLTGTCYFYIMNKDIDTGITQHVFTEAFHSGTGVFRVNNFVFDSYNPNIEKIYHFTNSTITLPGTSYKLPARIVNTPLGSDIDVIPDHGSVQIDFGRSFITKNVFLTEFGPSPAPYTHVTAKKNISGEGPYIVLGTPVENNNPAYYFPLYTSNDGERSNYVIYNFLEFPGMKFYMPPNVTTNFNKFYRPSHYGTSELSYFNEETLISNQEYTNSYIKINNENKYFLSDTVTVNSGMCYSPSSFYSLYSEENNRNYYLNSSVSNIPGTSSPQFSLLTVESENFYNEENKISTIEIIRGKDKQVVNANITTSLLTPEELKVNNYYNIIEDQNFRSDTKVNLVLFPEAKITLAADYSVFKSPYSYNTETGNLNFLCYDETGRPLEKGYKNRS